MIGLDSLAIIDGFESELELERELGVRVVEIDRSLLSPAPSSEPPSSASPRPRVEEPAVARPAASRPAADVQQSASAMPAPRPTEGRAGVLDFVFLHDRPLSQGGIEMMAKIVTAMKKTPETAPIVFTGERPAAKAYVLLGSGALRKWLPGAKGAPGEWVKDQSGNSYLVTYSPEFILRMGPPTPAVKEIKMKMWTSLKGVMQRVVGG